MTINGCSCTLRHCLPQGVSSLAPNLQCSVAGGVQAGKARQQRARLEVTTKTITIVMELVILVWILRLSLHNCCQC